jgi:hypothetical protein
VAGSVIPVFAPMMRSWQQVAERYTEDELRLIVDYYDQIEQIIRTHLATLRNQAPPTEQGSAGSADPN